MNRFLVRTKKSVPFFDCPVQEPGASYHPFFIVGSGRSGNTILRRVLQSNSSVHIPPETYVLGDVIRTFQNNAGIYWGDLVDLIMSKYLLHPEFETFNVDLRPLRKQLLNTPKGSRSLCFILDSFYRYHARSTANKVVERWGDKTPLNTMYLKEIDSVFPRAQYIHIIRDGCDVVYSYLSSKIYEDLPAAATRWRTSIERINKQKERKPDSVLEIRYEEFVTDTEKVAGEVCKFLDIGFDEEMIRSENVAHNMGDVGMHDHHKNVANKISNKSIGKGRRCLTRKQLSELNQLIGREMEELNYPPCL